MLDPLPARELEVKVDECCCVALALAKGFYKGEATNDGSQKS